MSYIVSLGVTHLLVDLPSVDRMYDEGRLSAHHIFWNLPPGSHATPGQVEQKRSITELIYVEDRVPDGSYALNIQIASFDCDAAPSRPFLFELEKVTS
jgi:hypothetical protein